ncbi:hypothetical protein PoB_000976100 [Plakobranchus ocellatus]|uniref:Uncharacterized protein n=1 Tax=Plakobranchus ocellatus TaxID=259542 RepID=A0AAV3Y7L1_9GAST|nr:hypothetical protein PoB_000976100 [Plakobranchus ocellatus]
MADSIAQNSASVDLNIGSGSAGNVDTVGFTSAVTSDTNHDVSIAGATGRDSQNTPTPVSPVKTGSLGIPDKSGGAMSIGDTPSCQATLPGAYSSHASDGAAALDYTGQAGGSNTVQGFTETEEIDVDAPDITPVR